MAADTLNLNFHFDAPHVLYISMDKREPAIGYHLDDRSDDVVIRCNAEGRVVGWTIIEPGIGEQFHVLPLTINVDADPVILPPDARTLILELDQERASAVLRWGRGYEPISVPIAKIDLHNERVQAKVPAA